MFTMAPGDSWARNWRISNFIASHTPLRLTEIIESKSSSSISASLVSGQLMPAQFTAISSLPNRLAVLATNVCSAAPSDTSHGSKNASAPPCSIRRTTASPSARLRPQMASFAPARASPLAIASPMPLVAPVTSATLPSRILLLIARISPQWSGSIRIPPSASSPAPREFRHARGSGRAIQARREPHMLPATNSKSPEPAARQPGQKHRPQTP